MNFTILFHIIGNLNFHVQFTLDSKYMQDFFIFQGGNSSAHLYRNNKTVSLYLHDDKGFQLYQTNILKELEFTWKGFQINGSDMKLIKSTGNTSMDYLNEFIFISPIIDIQPGIMLEAGSFNNNESESRFISPQNSKDVNYGYIAAIILIFAIALELKMKIPLLINRLFGKEINQKIEESDYVSMENMETNV